jgi:hypothetical protein
MAQKYGKEINDLRNKLNDANLLIEQNNQAKAQIQEQFKKSFDERCYGYEYGSNECFG